MRLADALDTADNVLWGAYEHLHFVDCVWNKVVMFTHAVVDLCVEG